MLALMRVCFVSLLTLLISDFKYFAVFDASFMLMLVSLMLVMLFLVLVSGL